MARRDSLDSVEAKLNAIDKLENDFEMALGRSSNDPDSNSLVNTSERIKRKVQKAGKDIREAIDVGGNFDQEILQQVIDGRNKNYLSAKVTNCDKNLPTRHIQRVYPSTFARRQNLKIEKYGAENEAMKT